MKTILILIVVVTFFSAFPVVSAQESDEPIQPVFRVPLNAGYDSLCTQGNNGSTSHQFNSTRYDIDFDTPNSGQTSDPQFVVAAADGVAHVVDGCTFGFTNCNSGFGNFVKVSHGHNIFSIYAHLKSISILDGERVFQGDVLGTEGSTGNSVNENGNPADHLHFGVHTGDPKDDLPGTSIQMEYMSVTDKSTINVDDQLIGGGDFVCGIPGGHKYEAADVPICHTKQEEVLRATCTPDDTRIAIGDNTDAMYVYHTGYETNGNNPWSRVPFQCIGETVNEVWCVGEAIGVISSQSRYFTGHTCTWDGRSWTCGWRLQTINPN